MGKARGGGFNEYNETLFRAFFERGEDISNTDVLTRLASEAGLEVMPYDRHWIEMSTWRAC